MINANIKWSSNHFQKRAVPKSQKSRKQKRNIMSNSVSLHRMLKTSPEKVFRAFTQPAAIASWLPPYGFLCTVDHMKVEKGGSFRMSFTNFSTGNSHSFGGTYLEIKPNEFLKYTDKFDDPNLPGEMVTAVSLRKTIAGTEIKITQDGIPAAIPAEMCYLGWQESLDKLMRLVEPDIPDA
jgi:uncharacterized protein YndB with AHSA1/START domain